MKNFKFTTKSALIIVLILIFAAGLYLYLRSGSTNKNTGQSDSKGFLSFFGERKIKPGDETVVPGANAGNTAGQTTALGGSATGGDTAGGNTGGNGNGGANGSLTLKPISSNVNNNGNITNIGGSGTSNGGGIGGNTGSGSNGGNGNTTGSGGGSTTGGPVEQINCTPKEIEFTEEEKAKLKELEARFYKVAAEIRTQQDVDTLVRTRQNYYNYLSSDYSATSKKDGSGVVELTKQCFAERQKVADGVAGFKDKPIGMRPNPFITKDMFNTLASIPPLRGFMNNERATLKNQIAKLTTDISDAQAKIEPLQKTIDDQNLQLVQLIIKYRDDFGRHQDVEDLQALIATNENLLNQYSNNVPDMKLKLERYKVLLDQVTNDPFSYFANSTTYVKDEPFAEKETELSRKNAVYQNVQGIFYDIFGWGDITDKLWGGGKAEWDKAPQSNPLKASGFAIPCDSIDKSKISRIEYNPLRCYERYYPMQDLERILGIW